MDDLTNINLPAVLPQIQAATDTIGFERACDKLTGVLLRTLAATKPTGMFLELGTGTGVSTAWLLDGMERNSQLITVEQDTTVVAVAQKYLGDDPRVTFHIGDVVSFIADTPEQSFDLIFVDAWSIKQSYLAETLKLLKVGGIFVIDDVLPQPTWTEEIVALVNQPLAQLEQRSDLVVTKLSWSSGLVIAAKNEAR